MLDLIKMLDYEKICIVQDIYIIADSARPGTVGILM
jgi:hypothetical protein